jgi:hypothetical protein
MVNGMMSTVDWVNSTMTIVYCNHQARHQLSHLYHLQHAKINTKYLVIIKLALQHPLTSYCAAAAAAPLKLRRCACMLHNRTQQQPPPVEP